MSREITALSRLARARLTLDDLRGETRRMAHLAVGIRQGGLADDVKRLRSADQRQPTGGRFAHLGTAILLQQMQEGLDGLAGAESSQLDGGVGADVRLGTLYPA